MPPTNQHIAAARRVYETYWDSYLNGDLETFASTLDENYEMIDTSEGEIAHNKADGIAFLKSQMQEMAGKAEMRNREISAKPVNEMLLINENCDIFVLAGTGWSFYSKIRISTFLHETPSGWKVAQQHGSLPDMRVQEGETLAIDKISRENVELRDAVKRRTAELEHKNWELEIEAALERVRTIAMGMQKPDDLMDVCRIISEQLELLKIDNIRNVQVAIIDEPKKIYANYQYFSAYANSVFEELGYENNPASRAMVEEMQKSANSFFIGSIKGDELHKFREWRKKYDQFPDPVLDDLTEVFYYFYSIGQGGLGLTTYQAINENELEIFKRFHLVFKLAYSRFMDIQQAEIQAQEARLELSLERIRAQVTSMQESADLLDIVVTMRTEFIKLGHEAHYFWYMRWLPEKYEKAMTSGDGTRIGMVMSLPRHIHGDVKLVADWEKSNEPTVVFAMDEETAVDYVHKMITLGDFQQVDPQAPTLDDVRQLGGLTFIMARTTLGEIGFSLPGEVQHPPTDAVDTLVRFAGVFDLAYKRFEDLKAAEFQTLLIREERDRLEIALKELRDTQEQLVQQEKLASLGQLTAGIAHEIKNPLNFVNNFSEVSMEMIGETLEEMEKREARDESLIRVNLEDIQSNLRKIHEHGTRADGIVKSMLMHSRGGSGKMEPTDLNALIKEYVNLSFHGMRAGKNPINVDIQLDLDDSFGEIALIKEDFSRVLLNLCNNAFDAMREKTKTDPGYKPLLSISTKQKEKAVEIVIADNGPGIPDDIKDKILQPFFTTKKGTEGTGLGLSITHDIVKAHGGELNISSTPDGTTFKIIMNK
jgi:signal transduction histidine kinase